ncbi:MAG: hypothetical protein WCX95_03070, partial [Candidatus Gracilibacteria bacterium]
ASWAYIGAEKGSRGILTIRHMNLFTTLMIVTTLGSILFCLLTVWKIFVYNRRYHLPESKYTKLFRITKKEHFAILYILMVSTNAIFGLWFAFTL